MDQVLIELIVAGASALLSLYALAIAWARYQAS